ncbi:MAG: (d)CMP kinase [Candidatus Omnitrophica bacterium]|nr:(d)CMP kinase [Candidatus Omnitrophota bacterium]MBU1048200.1 (d)CMP kinase [Candidatus Omnitrophota bacterium]MBU1631390.1 (d)CMP kinase [Candidatus Omnitrophota bacterium]MBU1888706.1 (d)CMP kinase [Candidatus Omnitrophota bacterium]
MKKNTIITIDGPAGAGKTTIAKEVAKRLGFLYLDTGAMYRALTLKALTEGITVEEEEKLVEMVKETILIAKKDDKKGMRIWVDGEEVTDKIRTEEVTNNIWWVCRVKDVRKKMKKLQREIGSSGGIVVEGRDIGTVVFPKAPFKFYLDASIDERAKRRWLEQTNKGIQSDLEKIKQDIKERDNKDFTREIAPLKKAEDAISVDTTGLSIEDVVGKIIEQVSQ